VALAKNTKHSPKIKQGVGQTEPDLVAFHDTGGQQTDRVYTSMSGARTGRRAVAFSISLDDDAAAAS